MTNTDRDASGKFIALICVIVLLVIFMGGYFGYLGVKGYISGKVEQYTDTDPAELPKVTYSGQEAETVLARVETFTKAIEIGGQIPELILTAQDINVLINEHPNWRDFAGKLHVSIEEDKIHGTVSIPLSSIIGMLEGRFLNGSAVFQVTFKDDQLNVNFDSLKIGGKEIPESTMNSLRAKNLAEETNMDEEARKFFGQLESITVKEGKLHIVPKPFLTLPDASNSAN